MKRRLICGTAALLLGLCFTLGGAVASEGRLAVGLAVSDSVFDVSGSEIMGSTTVFLGEAVTSGQLPTQLQVNEGSRYLVGVGSRVRVGRDKIALDGGSLEILTLSSDTPTLQVAGLLLTPQDEQTRAVAYISRLDILSVSVEHGQMIASRPNGEVIGKARPARWSPWRTRARRLRSTAETPPPTSLKCRSSNFNTWLSSRS